MTTTPPRVPRPARARPTDAPPPTVGAVSNAWMHAIACYPGLLLEGPAQFNDKAIEYWQGGPVEHTFTSAHLAMIGLAQREEHHTATLAALEAIRKELAQLQRMVHELGQEGLDIVANIATDLTAAAQGDDPQEDRQEAPQGEAQGGEVVVDEQGVPVKFSQGGTPQ